MNSTRRIGLLLVAVFLLPALFFSVYEISSLNRDEKIIQDIYNQQLEAMLFSVNQYADDVLSSWISKTVLALSEAEADSLPARIGDLLNLNASLQAVVVSASDSNASPLMYTYQGQLKEVLPGFFSLLKKQNSDEIAQLIKYKKSGFQKLSMMTAQTDTGVVDLVSFIASPRGDDHRFAGLLINKDDFIQDMIGPRLQSIAKDQFVISVYGPQQSVAVYSTAGMDSTEIAAEVLTKKFWIFPDYALGIRLPGTSLQQVVRERTNTNLILLLFLDVVLIGAVWLVFRNINREVQLAQSKADFVSNVSHEIRTPLALISMFAETLQMDRVPSEQKKKEYYDIINKETHRLSGIVNKILNFSQMEANKKVLHLTALYVDPEVKELLHTYDFHLRNKGFDYSYHGDENLCIQADKEALVEILVNLLDNAIKYSVETKKIEVFARSQNGLGSITVKDNGIGISKKDQKHIFEKFYRVSSGDLAKSRGTGLGLTLVKELTERQGGRVSVKSEPGIGSSFTVSFRLAEEV